MVLETGEDNQEKLVRELKRLEGSINARSSMFDTLCDPELKRRLIEECCIIINLAALVPKPRVNLTRFAGIVPDTSPLRGPAKAVQIHSR